MAFSSSGDDIAAKLKTKQNLKSAKDASRRLEEENKRMEERLFEFKKVMGNQRDDTQDTSLGFWKTGQTGQLSSYGKDLIEKKIKEGKQKKKAPKVKILKEEQLKLEQKPSKVSALKNLSSPKPGGKENKVKGVRCGQCEERAAHVSCLECGEDYCASCFAGFHLKGALKKHRSAPLGANNVIRTPRSTGSATFKPDISEIQSLPYTPKSPEESDMDHGETNGALMDGNYDEAANAREFQEALKAWRGEKTNTTSKEVSKPRSQVRVPVYSDTHKESAESGTSTEVVKGTVEIKFKQSLTYAERLLLKTHRREAGKSPSDSNQISSPEEITTWDSPVTRIGLDISDSEREKSIMRETSLHLSESRPTSQMSIIDISDDKPNRDRSKPTRHRSRYQVNESVDFNGSDFTERKEAFLSSRLENYDKKPEREKTITRAPPTKTVQENHDTKRPKSRLMSARGSRPMSARNTRPKSRAQRAKSALGGQLSARENYSEGGVLVKTPSEELKNISRRSETPVTYQTSYNSGSLGDFFLPQTETGNVTPRDQQNTRPASAAGQWKVSHKIYQTAPRSWKQDSSVIPAVDDEQLQRQVEETTLAYQTFMDGMDEDVHDSDDLNLYMTAKPEEKRPNSSRNSAKRREDIYADNEQLDDLALGRVTPNMMITPRKVYKTDPLDRPSSVASYSARAIVVDGDDMSQYDGNEPNYQAELNQEDSNALNILAAELAKDTKLDLFDKKDVDVRKKSGANMAQGRDLTKDDLLHGTDIMKMMRPSDLYDNPDELECLAGEEEVKALR